MKRFWMGAVLVCWFFLGWGVEAATLTALYGDQDGFGLGYHAGDRFKTTPEFYGALSSGRGEHEGITDFFGHGVEDADKGSAWRQWTLELDEEALRNLERIRVTALSLEMLTGAGPGFYGRSSLFFDADPGESETWMTVGPFARPFQEGGPYVRMDVFDLLPYQEWVLPCLRAGGVTFRIQTEAESGTLPYAGWMMDYSALTASGEACRRIPETATSWLLAGGLATLLVVMRRRMPSRGRDNRG